MKKYFQPLIAITFAALGAIGCASAPSHFYILNATAMGDSTTNSDYAVMVGPVSIPAEVNRPQFTVQVSPNQVAVDEFNRWAAPLNENIARVVAENLAILLATPRVTTTSSANFEPAYRVSISIQRFESVPGKMVIIDSVWVIREPANGSVQSGRTTVNEPVVGGDFDNIAAAHSRALGKVSSDIAAVIRAQANK